MTVSSILKKVKKIFYLPFPAVVFMLFLISAFIAGHILKQLGLSNWIVGFACYGLFMIATTVLKYHEDLLWPQLHHLSASEKKAIQELHYCSHISGLFVFSFMIVFLIVFLSLHLQEMIARVPAVSTSADYILLGSWIGLILYHLILGRFFKQRSIWHKESSSCN